MTIDEIIAEINNMRKFNYTLAPDEVFEMAIKALKQYGALQEIRQEIEQEQSGWIKGSDPEWHAFDKAIAIINKHIKEIEE